MEITRTPRQEEKGKRSPALVGLLLVQILLGYEWLSSGLTKVVHGDFPAGLADELGDRLGDAPGWYGGFLEGTVIPHAQAFGYAIEVGEILTGLALVATALVWLWAGTSLCGCIGRAVLGALAAAALAGVVMNVNFQLANGGSAPLPIAADSFDEAVDLDSLMAALELVLVAVSIHALRALRPASVGSVHQRSEWWRRCLPEGR